ncbi:hypothetical protein N7495_004450 [Penicillium taxi]|uniref:uncharacterized protein n=1 Tax=Penicillium taxi TaxID=168475 RepID=UPI00254556A9|nr:uncharacterized protein N7495_004450 [Penicillium taxi]KAJ5899706.1 hypothetical protein N7495_004450 [Penicillium taxi]
MRTGRNWEERQAEESKTFPALIPSLPTEPQTYCPLLVLPAEIRNLIYAFSLESEDFTAGTSSPESLYRRNAFYYRPGYNKPKRAQTALLQTCQKIYNEASLLPPAVNEHTFWFYRPPPHIKDASSPVRYFRKMTPKQRTQVQHIHLFIQQYFLEDRPWSEIWNEMKIGDGGRSLRGECRIAPKKITITFRHTDWWYWEYDETLGINPFRSGRTRSWEMDRPFIPEQRAWGNQFAFVTSLKEVVIEFETVLRKKDQLDGIIKRALQWKFPMQDENNKRLCLIADPGSVSAYTWIGAKETDLKKQPRDWHPHSEDPEPVQEPIPPVPTLKPFVLASDGGTPLQLDHNAEEFYVVFLTWRKQIVHE